PGEYLLEAHVRRMLHHHVRETARDEARAGQADSRERTLLACHCVLLEGTPGRPCFSRAGRGASYNHAVQARMEAVAGHIDDATSEQALDVRVVCPSNTMQRHRAEIGVVLSRERQDEIALGIPI